MKQVQYNEYNEYEASTVDIDGMKPSAAISLTQLSQYILLPAPESLLLSHDHFYQV